MKEQVGQLVPFQKNKADQNLTIKYAHSANNNMVSKN